METFAVTQAPEAGPGALIGAISGVVAGAAYLCAQVTFAATVHEGSWAMPLQQISAILLGDDVLVPVGEMSTPVFAMAVFIHAWLCIVYGRMIGFLVQGRGAAQAAATGAGFGVALFGVNFWLIAPNVFPWFERTRTFTTIADHVLFGVAAALCYTYLRAVAETHLAARKQIT